MGPSDLAAEVAEVARILARLGYVHAFGHVSARIPAGEGGRVLLTPTFPPLGELAAADVLELDAEGRLLGGVAGHRPLEAPLHLAVYAARPDVGAICRVHAPAVAAAAAVGEAPPLLHGFGGMVEPVAVWDDPDLVAGGPVGGRVAGVLGDAPAMLLAGSGVTARLRRH